MAVSFDEEDIIALGVDVDPAVSAQLQAALNDFKNSVDQTNAKLEQAAETSAKVTENLSKLGSSATAGVDQAKASVEGLSDQLSAAAEKAEELSKAMPYNTAYDVPRPPPAPGQYASPNAEPEVEPPEVPGGGVSSGGSAFSLARGLSVAGHATGSPVLREAGGLIYMEEGIRKSLPLFRSEERRVGKVCR